MNTVPIQLAWICCLVCSIITPCVAAETYDPRRTKVDRTPKIIEESVQDQSRQRQILIKVYLPGTRHSALIHRDVHPPIGTPVIIESFWH